jgi:formylglycine-generating enzyme required for sulfatase activity
VRCQAELLQRLYEPTPGARITPLARAEWGRILAEQGDPRPGVLDFNFTQGYWCAVPAGEYPYQDETVTLEAFQIGKYPITYAQFERFVTAEDGYRNPKWWDGLHAEGKAQQQKGTGEQSFKYANHPRENVSWYDAMAFCAWLTACHVGTAFLPSDRVIRLPTVPEWEAAAYGPQGLVYPWGDEYVPGYANINEIGKSTGLYYLRKTTAVGMYPQGSSWCGALDIRGNIWEWMLTEFLDENNITSNDARTLCGQSWSNNYDFARVALSRYVGGSPHHRNDVIGFRVVLGGGVPLL